jgi:hypothetical protein
MGNMAVQHKLHYKPIEGVRFQPWVAPLFNEAEAVAMAGWNGTSKPRRSTKLLCLLLRSSLAASLLLCLSRATIDAALIPKRAPASFAGTKGRILNQWNPNVAANIADRNPRHFPTHSRDYT